MTKLIAYTDGACKVNPGPTGYGIHILKIDSEIKPKRVLQKWCVTEKGYVPKAMLKTNNLTEYGISKIIDVYGYLESSNTNNQAELDAVIQLFENILYNPQFQNILGDYDKLLIKTDSTYVIGTIEKILNKDKRLDEMANQPHLQKLKKLMTKFGLDRIEVDKVLAHSGHIGNEKADLLANMGVIRLYRDLSPENIIVSDFDNYYKLDFDKNPLLNDAKLAFDYSIYNDTIPNRYYLVTYKDEVDLGRRDKDVVYQVLKTNEPINELVKFSKLMSRITDTMVKPFVIKIPELFHKQIHKNLELYDIDYVTEHKKSKVQIKTVDDVLLATEVYPPSLSYLANEILSNLENILDDYTDGKLYDNQTVFDITDMLYDISDKGYKFKPEYKNDKFHIKLKTDYGTIKLYPKLDFPSRNILKKLEKQHPNIIVLLEKIGKAVRWYTIISLDNGDRTIITNYYANTIPNIKQRDKKDRNKK
jgi:ribonuclease HI